MLQVFLDHFYSEPKKYNKLTSLSEFPGTDDSKKKKK